MKVSISLRAEDVEFLDAYADREGHASRSAAVQHAVAVLRMRQLSGAYEEAWQDWDNSGDADAWESATADGLDS